jgi:hypothetical protein
MMNDKSNKLPTSLEVVHRNLPYQYLVRLPRKTDSNRGGMAFARFLEKLPQAGDSCSRIRVRLNPEEASGEAAERRFVPTVQVMIQKMRMPTNGWLSRIFCHVQTPVPPVP